MTWLVFLYALTIGVENTDFHFDHQYDWYGYSKFEAGVLLWDKLELGGSVNTKFIPVDIPYFSPFQAEFIIFTQLHFGLLTIGADHMCIHKFQGFYYRKDYVGYNRFYLQLSNRK